MPKPIHIQPKRPDILLDGDYHQQMSAIQSACKEHGFLYEQAGTLVRVRGDEIDILSATKLQSHLIDLTRPIETWYRTNSKPIYNWILADVELVDDPRIHRGMLGFWEVDSRSEA